VTKRRWLAVVWILLGAYWAADLAIQLRRTGDPHHTLLVVVPIAGIVICALGLLASQVRTR
jgi:hypothetical protein